MWEARHSSPRCPSQPSCTCPYLPCQGVPLPGEGSDAYYQPPPSGTQNYNLRSAEGSKSLERARGRRGRWAGGREDGGARARKPEVANTQADGENRGSSLGKNPDDCGRMFSVQGHREIARFARRVTPRVVELSTAVGFGQEVSRVIARLPEVQRGGTEVGLIRDGTQKTTSNHDVT